MRFSILVAVAITCCGTVFVADDVSAQGPAGRPGKTPVQSTYDLSAYQSGGNGSGLFLPPIQEIAPQRPIDPWLYKKSSHRNTVDVSSLQIGGERNVEKEAAKPKNPITTVVRKQGAPQKRILPTTSLASVIQWILPTRPWTLGLTVACVISAASGSLFYVLQRRRNAPPAPKNLAVGLVETRVRRKNLAIPVVVEQTMSRRRAA